MTLLGSQWRRSSIAWCPVSDQFHCLPGVGFRHKPSTPEELVTVKPSAYATPEPAGAGDTVAALTCAREYNAGFTADSQDKP